MGKSTRDDLGKNITQVLSQAKDQIQVAYANASLDSVIKNLETQLIKLRKEQAAPSGYVSSATMFLGKALAAVESRTFHTNAGKNLQNVVQGATTVSDTKIEVKIQALEQTLACLKAYDSFTTGSAAYLKSTFDNFKTLFVNKNKESYDPTLEQAYLFADREAASKNVDTRNLSRLAASFLDSSKKDKDPFGLNVFNYPDAEGPDFSEKENQDEGQQASSINKKGPQ